MSGFAAAFATLSLRIEGAAADQVKPFPGAHANGRFL
jgi:hypothetical protein